MAHPGLRIDELQEWNSSLERFLTLTEETEGGAKSRSIIGIMSGWKCEAEGDLTIVFNDDGKHIPLVYGTERTDVRKHGQCLDIARDNVGFVAIWNWAALEDGEHEAVAYDNGVEFDRSTFTVGTILIAPTSSPPSATGVGCSTLFLRI